METEEHGLVPPPQSRWVLLRKVCVAMTTRPGVWWEELGVVAGEMHLC